MLTSSLDEVLRHEHPAALARFRARWAIDADDADLLWRDTLRWLWLCGTRRERTWGITPSLTLVDELWHTFLLFTVDYAAFCERHLGGFVHHHPGGDDAVGPAPGDARAWLRDQIAAVHDLLGADVAIRWYQDYARRFAPHQLSALHLAWRAA